MILNQLFACTDMTRSYEWCFVGFYAFQNTLKKFLIGHFLTLCFCTKNNSYPYPTCNMVFVRDIMVAYGTIKMFEENKGKIICYFVTFAGLGQSGGWVRTNSWSCFGVSG